MRKWHLLRRIVLAILPVMLLVGSALCPLAISPVLAQQDPPGEKKEGAEEEKTEDQANEKDLESAEYFELLQLFVDTVDQIDRNYVNDVSRRELMEAAIEGMIKKLDQYSNYIPPPDMERFRSNVENEFGGIGIRISSENDKITVISPLYGTPAYKGGILAGDQITRIDGESIEQFSLEDTVKKLKGPLGSEVTLTVVHPRDGKERTITVKRELVRVETVLGARRNADDSWNYYSDEDRKVGFIQVTGFSRHTLSELRRVMATLKENDLQALVLDLRFNPGGLLSSAIAISDLFISTGRIVSTEGRNSPRNEWNAHKSGSYEGFPMVVLVNRYSASASEIVSACLQDHQRALIIGERTWGKGSVQNIIELEGGKSALKLTTAGYHRPNGKNIHRFPDATPEDEWGVKPNDGYDVRFSLKELQGLGAYRRQVDILRKDNPLPEGEAAPSFDDRQLNKAMEFLLAQLDKAEAEKGKEKKDSEEKKKEDPAETGNASDKKH
tara:strand:+ start:4169 stop:5662 length:1494 start_codon:yes stop_codon:yes gene_type:complete